MSGVLACVITTAPSDVVVWAGFCVREIPALSSALPGASECSREGLGPTNKPPSKNKCRICGVQESQEDLVA